MRVEAKGSKADDNMVVVDRSIDQAIDPTLDRSIDLYREL